jgi:hypothetical protein
VLAPLLLVSVKRMPVICELETLGRTANPGGRELRWDRPSGKGSTPIGETSAIITGAFECCMVAQVATSARPGIRDQAVVTPVATSGLSAELIAPATCAVLMLLMLKVIVSGMMAMIVTCPALEATCAAVNMLVAAGMSASISIRIVPSLHFILSFSTF